MTAFRRATGVAFGLPIPEWALKPGAFIIRTEPELLLKSRRVIPGRLLKVNYKFEFDEIEPALIDLMRQARSIN